MGFIMAFAYNPSYTLLVSSIFLSGSLPTSSSPHPNTLPSSIISHAVRAVCRKVRTVVGEGRKEKVRQEEVASSPSVLTCQLDRPVISLL